VTKDKMGL